MKGRSEHACQIINAKSLYRSAELLAERGSYGHAVSLLILSAEEAVKGLVAFGKLIGMDLTADESDRYAKSHTARIQFSKLLLTFGKYVQPIVEESGDSIELKLVIRSAIVRMVRDFENGTLSEDVKDMRAWWQNANLLKQRGLYAENVDGVLHSPSSIGQPEYEQTKAMVDPLVIGARVWVAVGRSSDSPLTEFNLESDMAELMAELESDFRARGYMSED